MSTAPVQPSTSSHLLPRAVVLLLGMAAAVVVIAGLKGANSILGPAFLALVLTIAAHPLRRLLDRHVPSWVATIVCLVVVNLVILMLALALLVSAARFATLLTDYSSEADALVEDVGGWFDRFDMSASQVDRITSSFDLSTLGGLVGGFLSGLLGAVSGLAFILTLILFMTVDGSQFPRHFATAMLGHAPLGASLVDFARATRSYLVVSTVFGLIVAVLDTIALAVLGVPAPLVWGLLAFLTNYIPNIGFVIGVIPPAVLGLLEGGPGLMIAVIAVYSVLNVVIQSVIQPKVVGDAVGLSTTLTFLSLVFWSWILGPLGAILAIPLSLLVRALLIDADPENQWLVPLVANSDVPPGP